MELVRCDDCAAIIDSIYYHIEIDKKIYNQDFIVLDNDGEGNFDLCPVCFDKLKFDNAFLNK